MYIYMAPNSAPGAPIQPSSSLAHQELYKDEQTKNSLRVCTNYNTKNTPIKTTAPGGVRSASRCHNYDV